MLTSGPDIRNSLYELEQRRYTYLIDGDAQGYSRLCHPELVFVHATGAIDTRETFLASVRNAEMRYHKVEHPVHSVTIVGTTGVVMGDVYAELSVHGAPLTLRNRVVATWAYNGTDWLLLSHIGTRLSEGMQQ